MKVRSVILNLTVFCGIFLVSSSITSNQDSDYYTPKLSDVTVPGSEIPVEDSPISVNIVEGDSSTSLVIESESVQYQIIPDLHSIHCRQKIGINRESLLISFQSGMLENLSVVKADSGGYIILSNQSLIMAFHSDGTLWVYQGSPGKDIIFTSAIDLSYDIGGGIYPLNWNECEATRRIIQTNWMVITDEGASKAVETTGGFGIYTRPARAYVKDFQRTAETLSPDYYSKFIRTAHSNVAVLKNYLPDPQSKRNILSQSSFIVSIFPCKNAANHITTERFQFLYPYISRRNKKGETFRASPYFFPDEEELRAWTDTSWHPYNNYPDKEGFHYYSPSDSIPLPITAIILFEGIWETSEEALERDPQLPLELKPYPYIPYTPPSPYYDNRLKRTVNPGEELKEFLAMAHRVAPEMKVLLYISALSDYNQVSWKLDENDYYQRFYEEVNRLISEYGKENIGGFYIDTLPLDGRIGYLEPLILSYRILRDLTRLYPDLTIILHSSENPIGPQRVYVSQIRKQPFSLCPEKFIQFIIYAPFVDRYADVILRGEAFPMNIDLVEGEISNWVSPHIKYGVYPIGKS